MGATRLLHLRLIWGTNPMLSSVTPTKTPKPSTRRSPSGTRTVWYDEGIPAAGEWLEEIAAAICDCCLFIVLVSPRSVLSQYVKNEILFALDKGRPFLAIHMENTGLPKGLELCMSGYQALPKYEMAEDRYERKLRNVLNGYLGQSATIDLPKPQPIEVTDGAMDTQPPLPGLAESPKEPDPILEEEPEVGEPEEVETRDTVPADTPAEPDARDHEIEVVEPEEDESVPTDLPAAAPVQPDAVPATPDDSLADSKLAIGRPFLVTEIDHPLLWVNPGSFEVLLPWNGETVEVPVTQGFWFGERLITQSDYLRIVGRQTNYFWDSNQLPVEQVSWLDCIEFCKALTALEQRERRLPPNYEFRLPLEIEWEYACRAGSNTPYFFGSDPKDLTEYAWVRANSKRRTHDVARKKPNPWGFYDMCGNVREWVHDSYYNSLNESLISEIPDEYRISRGGGYMARGKDCESTARYKNSLFHRFRNLGFRIALSVVRDEDA